MFWQAGCLEVATAPARLGQRRRDAERGRDARIEARALDAAEAEAAEKDGARFRFATPVRALETGNGRVVLAAGIRCRCRRRVAECGCP